MCITCAPFMVALLLAWHHWGPFKALLAAIWTANKVCAHLETITAMLPLWLQLISPDIS